MEISFCHELCLLASLCTIAIYMLSNIHDCILKSRLLPKIPGVEYLIDLTWDRYLPWPVVLPSAGVQASSVHCPISRTVGFNTLGRCVGKEDELNGPSLWAPTVIQKECRNFSQRNEMIFWKSRRCVKGVMQDHFLENRRSLLKDLLDWKYRGDGKWHNQQPESL